MKNVIVTGATGFLGYHLVQQLLLQGDFVYAVIRPQSKNRNRLIETEKLKIIELAMCDVLQLPCLIPVQCEVFYHLAWEGERNAFFEQNKNVKYTIDAVEAAKQIGCRRFLCTGSQAEYGLQPGIITEETLPQPVNAYGAAKLAACALSRMRARQLELDWIWPRVFSVYGIYDNPKALIPYLLRTLRNSESPCVSAATQNWDYLYSLDAARVLVSLGEKGAANEIYNVASGDIRPLRHFIEQVRAEMAPEQKVVYDKVSPHHLISLSPSIEKVLRQVDWHPEFKFLEGINDIIKRENL